MFSIAKIVALRLVLVTLMCSDLITKFSVKISLEYTYLELSTVCYTKWACNVDVNT